METFGYKSGPIQPFDCCDKEYQDGDLVYNVGDSIEVILYCDEHYHSTKEEA